VIGPEHEAVQVSGSASSSDAVTFAFADPVADLYGYLRLALSPPHDEAARLATAAAALLTRDGPVASVAAPDVPVRADSAWDAFALEGVAMTTPGPLEWWSAALVDPRSGAEVELVFHATGPPEELHAAALDGYRQPCRVQGVATVGGIQRPIDCDGRRDHTWGELDREAPGPRPEGEHVCGCTLELGELRLDVAFVEGRGGGVSCRETLRRA
jgi:hypothetical protein